MSTRSFPSDSVQVPKKRKLIVPVPVLPISLVMKQAKQELQFAGKLQDISDPRVVRMGTAIVDSANGTLTPMNHFEDLETQPVDDPMEIDLDRDECSCGYLHGPGQGNHHDVKAVGLAEVPLLRGPD